MDELSWAWKHAVSGGNVSFCQNLRGMTNHMTILEGLSTVSAHEEWTLLSVSEQRPKPRYEGTDSSLDDCVLHLICPCCTLCQVISILSSATSAAASRLPFAVPSPSPSLDNEDVTNLRNLYRLLLLSKVPQKENSSPIPGYNNTGEKEDDSSDDISLVLYEMRSLPEFLPVLFVIPELPAESQQQFLLPADLTNRVISRAVARTIRRMFI